VNTILGSETAPGRKAMEPTEDRNIALTVHLVTEETMDELLADYRERRSRLRREVRGAAALAVFAALLGGIQLAGALRRSRRRR